MWISHFYHALSGVPQWHEGSRCFIFLSMVNLNLMPLKIIYYCVNNVQILRKQNFGVWNWASLDLEKTKCLDCWCIKVWTGLVPGCSLHVYWFVKWESCERQNQLRIPLEIDLIQTFSSQLHTLSVYLTGIFAESQHHSICVNLM